MLFCTALHLYLHLCVVYVHECMFVCVHACMSVHECMFVCVQACMSVHECMFVCVYACMSVHVSVCAFECVCVCVRARVRARARACVFWYVCSFETLISTFWYV